MIFKSWKTIKSEVFKQTPWTTFRQNEFEMPNGKKGMYYFVDSRGSSFIVPVTNEGRIVLTEQYRYLIDEDSIEFPGGGVIEGDDYIETAKKELEEETGYIAEKFTYIGEFIPMNGVTNEICKVYIAEGLMKGEAMREETEDGMRIFEVEIKEFEMMIKRNAIKDGMTLASWQLAKKHLNIK